MKTIPPRSKGPQSQPVLRSLQSASGNARPVIATVAPPGCPPLRIDRIDLYSGTIPVNCSFSYGTISFFSFSVVVMHSGALRGWGETLHPQNTSMPAILPAILGSDARDLDRLVHEVLPGEADYRFEAVSIALHDLVARAAAVPMHTLFGPVSRNQVPLAPCVFATNPQEAAQIARKYETAGFRHLKLKLTGDPERDLQTILLVHQAVGPAVELRGDANTAYSSATLLDGWLARFKRAGLEIIEDPCADMMLLPSLRSKDHPLIMADVAARSNASLRKLLETGAVDRVNLHPCQQGSLSQALRRHALCSEFNVPVFIGGTGFLGIGSAAYLQLASVIGTSEPCGEICGAFDHGMPRLWSTIEPRNGTMRLAERSGIGFDPEIEPLQPFINQHRNIV